MNYIKILIFISYLLCSCNRVNVEVIEETFPILNSTRYNTSISFTDIEFITPELGYAIRHVIGDNDKSSLLQKTIDGGRSWNTISLVDENASGIEYYDNKLYIYGNTYSNRFAKDETAVSNIYQSNDQGLTWHKIYTFDSKTSNFHVVDSLNMFIVKAEQKAHWLYQSHDGGITWNKVNDLSSVSGNAWYVSFDKDKVYFYGGRDREPEKNKFQFLSLETNIYSYDIKTEEISIYVLPYYVYALYVSDGLLSTAKRGSKIEYYKIENENLKKISNVDWGRIFGGAIMSKPLIKDGDYVFSFISQFPGRDNIVEALYFSDNGGKNWKMIREFNLKERIGHDEYYSISNDSIFQVAYTFADSLRIFKVNKRR